jgi:hypothetical protein
MPSIFIIFKKKPENNIENFVSWCAGPMVHCDIVPGDKRIMFTSYMFERFSMNQPNGYSQNTHECLSLHVSQEEHDEVQSMLLSFVERGIPYNYADVFKLIMPMGKDPDDVVEDKDVKTLFCSQAIVLVLKMTLSQEHNAYETIQTLNSRVTTPSMLYDALKPFCDEAQTFFTQ